MGDKNGHPMQCWNHKHPQKGIGSKSLPFQPHEYWYTIVLYLNILRMFYYLCGVFDGYSRYIVHWVIRDSMKQVRVLL
jgi:putative transposase